MQHERTKLIVSLIYYTQFKLIEKKRTKNDKGSGELKELDIENYFLKMKRRVEGGMHGAWIGRDSFFGLIFTPFGVGRSRRYCNTGPTRGQDGASPYSMA